MFRHFCYAIRNFYQAYKESTYNNDTALGRWHLKKCNPFLNNYLANVDSCGDTLCGDIPSLQKNVSEIIKKKEG